MHWGNGPLTTASVRRERVSMRPVRVANLRTTPCTGYLSIAREPLRIEGIDATPTVIGRRGSSVALESLDHESLAIPRLACLASPYSPRPLAGTGFLYGFLS